MNRITTFALTSFTALFLGQTGVNAHEAWLLTPSEVEELSRAPMPVVFTSSIILMCAGLLAGISGFVALHAETRLLPVEQRLMAAVADTVTGFGLLAVRIGLALMLGLGALGGLARAGTQPWTQPVLFVPDMQLVLAPGWEWLAPVALGLSLLLAVGLLTGIAAAGVVVLSCLGFIAFGMPFLSYAPHFVAPALVLLAFGPGWLAADRYVQILPRPSLSVHQNRLVWHSVMALVGATFVYLGVVHKLLQPTLLIAILQHGRFPTFGVPIEWIALVMTGVEIVAGLLLAMGRLVRPVAMFLIGAFTFFAVMLGESPLLHANLYGIAILMLIVGARPPEPRDMTLVLPMKLMWWRAL